MLTTTLGHIPHLGPIPNHNLAHPAKMSVEDVSYKLHLFTDNELTFLLTNGGHNAGVVSEPGHRGRRYHIATRHTGDNYVDSDTWLSVATLEEGSWWPAWAEWLERHCTGEQVTPPKMGAPERGFAPLGPAPRNYVLQR